MSKSIEYKCEASDETKNTTNNKSKNCSEYTKTKRDADSSDNKLGDWTRYATQTDEFIFSHSCEWRSDSYTKKSVNNDNSNKLNEMELNMEKVRNNRTKQYINKK